jgi:hypothetical protein
MGFDIDDPAKEGENGEEANSAALAAAAASGKLKVVSDDDDDDCNNENQTLHSDNVNMNPLVQKQSSQVAAAAAAVVAPSNQQSSNTVSNSSSSSATTATQSAPINLVLRMRDEKKELQDIKFEFLPNKDTVDEISHELVNAKLIDAIDMVAVSANLSKLLENHSLSPITFPLVRNFYFSLQAFFTKIYYE